VKVLFIFVAVVAALVALWPARPTVSPVESQDKHVEVGPEQGFTIESVPLADSARVNCIHNTFDRLRPTIVFLHGFPDNFYSFSNQLMFFKDDHNVLAVSLRGYDVSSAKNVSGLLSVANLAEDVMVVLDYFQLSAPVHVVGHDWGSIIAQLACKAHPERFESITMIAVPHVKRQGKAMRQHPAQFTNSWYMMFFQLPFLPEWWFSRNEFDGFEWLFRSWGNGIIPNPQRIASIKRTYKAGGYSVVSAIIGYYRQNIFQLLIAQAKKEWGFLPLTSADGDIPKRALLLFGERDWCILPRIGELSTNRSDFKEGLERVQVADGGHFVHQEVPDQVNKLILQIVRGKTISRL